MRYRNVLKKRCWFALLMSAVLLITGCSQKGTAIPTGSPSATMPATVTPTATPIPPVPELLSIVAVPDPTLETSAMADPYEELSKYTKETYNPDKELFNTLFRAVDAMEPSVDISSFDLTLAQKAQTAESLYYESQFRFFYMTRVKVSKDGKSVKFTYMGAKDGSSLFCCIG